MTPDEMRRAAECLESSAHFFQEHRFRGLAGERSALAAKLRAMAEAAEQRDNWTKQDKD